MVYQVARGALAIFGNKWFLGKRVMLGRVDTPRMNAGLHGRGDTSMCLRRACLGTCLLNVVARRACKAGVLEK